jgi:transmembrane sensor
MGITRNEQALEQAAYWHARLGAPDCTDRERAEFERWWLAAHAHARAFAAAEALSEELPRAAAAGSRLEQLADEAFAMGRGASPERVQRLEPRRSARRWFVPAALAASVAVGAVSVRLAADFKDAAAVPPVVYSTADARRDVTLSDGSVVSLDVASEISVRITETERQIVLVDGRAVFDVAHDAMRPFVVSAAGSRTTALGTRFQVQREGHNVVVTLAEGKVAVTGRSESSTDWQTTLVPGEQISIDPAASTAPRKRVVDASTSTAWTRGRLVFHGTPLDEALAEVNRYSDRKVRLGDPALAELNVAGNFIAGDSEAAVSAFAAMLPLRAVDGSGGELILFRRYKAEDP